MHDDNSNGTIRDFPGKRCIYYDGYWIRYYAPPEDTHQNKRRLIDNLTRRTFHHTERGINTPGDKLELARAAWEAENDPDRKRVNAAMLAGALFNRATDIYTHIVELEEKGVEISTSNELMRECGQCFREALDLGQHVRHYSGHEGIDELWGEPFKAFTMSLDAFYKQRYVKIAMTMRDIDHICEVMRETFATDPAFDGIAPLLNAFCEAAKLEAETMKVDPSNFTIWPQFVAASEKLGGFQPQHEQSNSDLREVLLMRGSRLIRDGKELVTYIAGARVPMPKSKREYVEQLEDFSQRLAFTRKP
jgi:hypothetical protein